jgi:hypothetical protein
VATNKDAEQAVLDLIVETAGSRAGTGGSSAADQRAQSETILRLAEAYAWLHNPRHAAA